MEMLTKMIATVDVPIVQSGGIATMDDIRAVAKAGAEGVIVGKAIYEGNVTVRESVQLGSSS